MAQCAAHGDRQEDMCGVDDFFFFFQAEDGIRDVAVTGVQTCALPICSLREPQPSTTGVASGAGSVSISKWVGGNVDKICLGTTLSVGRIRALREIDRKSVV